MTVDDKADPRAAAALDLAGDAPIALSVELARIEVTLSELASWRTGEVIATGRPIGERVTLSVRGRPIARGELVEHEGELGVRILELARAEPG